MEPLSPTPYPDVNNVLNRLLGDVKRILGKQLIGMYLFGSLANGGFDDHSDIDILFVTKTNLASEVLGELYKMHETIAAIDSPWAVQLEVSYIPKEAIRQFNPSNNNHPHLDRGPGEKLHMMQHDSDWIVQRYILRKRGITITGPDPTTLIAPVSPDDLRLAVADTMQNWYRYFLQDRDRINSRGYQSYIVFTQCRILYTYEHGEIVSKRAAADWVKQKIDNKWTGLIDRAWSGRQTPDLDAQAEDIDGTLDLIRYTLEYITRSERQLDLDQ